MTRSQKIKSPPRRTARKEEVNNNLPLFCDYSCTHAAFAEADTIGACRKELAVYCTLFHKHNNKNSSCIGRKQ